MFTLQGLTPTEIDAPMLVYSQHGTFDFFRIHGFSHWDAAEVETLQVEERRRACLIVCEQRWWTKTVHQGWIGACDISIALCSEPEDLTAEEGGVAVDSNETLMHEAVVNTYGNNSKLRGCDVVELQLSVSVELHVARLWNEH